MHRLIKTYKYEEYKLIFHPKLFAAENYFYNESTNDSLILEKHWVVDHTDIYKIRINGRLGSSKTSYSYLIDENYKFLEYEGCNKEITKMLTNENLVN